MRNLQRQSKWFIILALSGALVVTAAACGRVNLQDLTPEAVQTEQAEARVTQTAIAGMGGGGDAARGRITWDTWCVGCHAITGAGQGPDLRGNIYSWEELEPAFRTEGAPLATTGNAHPIVYEDFELGDDNFLNVFAYLTQQTR